MPSDDTRNILLVVDDPRVCDEWRRVIGLERPGWTLSLALDQATALSSLERGVFDVLVTEVDASEFTDRESLLATARDQSPRTARIVISDAADRTAVLRRLGVAHRFLHRPCDPTELTRAIGETLAVRETLHDEALKAIVARLQSLPSLPTLYLRLLDELNRREPSITSISSIVSQDVAIAAKLLQLVNSAYFGRPGRTADIEEAVRFLGLETLQALMLGAHVFSTVHCVSRHFKPSALWHHSMAVSALARQIAVRQHAPSDVVTAALTAGLLHDCGKLLLASTLPWEFDAMSLRARREGVSLWRVERDAMECTHAEIGAYLLGLWGLPDSVVAAVAFHHRPSDSGSHVFDALTAVHAANSILVAKQQGECVDYPYLDRLGLRLEYEEWGRIDGGAIRPGARTAASPN